MSGNLYQITHCTTGTQFAVWSHLTDWTDEDLLDTFGQNATRRKGLGLPVSDFARCLMKFGAEQFKIKSVLVLPMGAVKVHAGMPDRS